MKLNIYEKKKIVKTYEVDAYDLLWGTVEDVADAIKLDDLETGSDAEIIKMALGMVIHSKDTVTHLMKDIFDGLTDDELKRVRVSEMVTVLTEVVAYTLKELKIGFSSKN